MTGRKNLLSIKDLRLSIPTDEGVASILNGVSLDVPAGSIVGVAGESGCGKSTLIRAILRILPARARVASGSIMFDDRDLLSMPEQEMQSEIRGKAIGFIPQDPYLALNPVFPVGMQLLEVMRSHHSKSGPPRSKPAGNSDRDELISLLRAVHLPDPEVALSRYPHQFSGGQRQRLLIAAALACRPKLILADEPTTALDVTTQQQILRLLRQVSSEFDVSMLFISHDFGVISELCDTVSVMYAGQTSETGPVRQVIDTPLHPYTRLLLRCHPDHGGDLEGIPGQVSSALAQPGGCHFHPRCPQRLPRCSEEACPLMPSPDDRHAVACWLHAQERP